MIPYEIAILDLARNPSDKDLHPYSFAEQLKNGIFSSNKYNSVTKNITPPKVLWLSNNDPDRTRLSEDRFCVHIVNKNTSDMTLINTNTEPDIDWNEIMINWDM
jgi:hypothetical protein